MMNFLFLLVPAVLFCFSTPVFAQETTEITQKQNQETIGGVKSLEKRIKQLEDSVDREVEGDKWYDRIQVSGVVEVEAGYQNVDVPGEESEKTSDIDLATVELGVDARIAKHVDGHVLVKWEEDEIFVDDGFITLTGSESFPGYMIAGRQYMPFGYYDSHFLSDPNTLVLGETNQGSLVLGYRFGDGLVDITAGAFNGSVHKVDDDDQIDSFVAGVFSNPFEGFMIGASYTSNLASSDTFSEFVSEEVEDLVGGWSAYATYEFLSRFKLIAEYMGALDKFKPGEVYGAGDTKEREPTAWNLEAGAMIIENLEIALRYGGSDDGGAGFLPESQYGGVINWGVFDSTNLALEYMHDEFEDDAQEVDTITAQLAIEF